MRRVVIRNPKNPNPVKPRLFDVLIDDDDIFVEIKAKTNGSEIIALSDIVEQIVSSDPGAAHRIRVRGSP